MAHTPKWFQDGFVIAANSPTCGINKDGLELFKVDHTTGQRSTTDIDDALSEDVRRVTEGKINSGNVFRRPLKTVLDSHVLVPQYHDASASERLQDAFEGNSDFKLMSLKDAVSTKMIRIFHGHGSPSDDQRVGNIPYIKVSDIRAGHININPSNLVPLELAKTYWGGSKSGLAPYDLISPERASKNIGEFAILMPGQEQILLTKEVIIVRGLNPTLFDQFYLLWALTLELVCKQWHRIVLMQTNREDVGDRLYEVIIPIPNSYDAGAKVSQDFRNYYAALEKAREAFTTALKNPGLKHQLFLG